MKKNCFNYMMIAFISLCTSAYGWAQKTINLNEEGVRIQTLSTTTQNVPAEYMKMAKTARSFTINKALQSVQGVKVGDVITLDLFTDKSYEAKVSKVETDVNGTLAITAKLVKYPMGLVIITTASNKKSLVTVDIPELKEEYVSRGSISSPQSYLIEVDEAKEDIKRGGNDAILPPPSSTSADKGTSAARKLKTFDDGGGVNDPANIDIMVVYTPAAEQWSNYYVGGIANSIANAVTIANACANSSQVIATFTLVHSERVSYTEAGNDMTTDLYRLTYTNDGYMDNVHQLRDRYSADLVVLFEVTDDYGGLGWLGSPDDGSYGFSCVRVQQASGSTVAHEMGHNIGMDHNRENGTVPNLYAPYAYGWHWGGADNRAYGSVMSYIGTGLYYYSNPNVSSMGKPTGDASVADNARLFRERKHIVAAYRPLCSLPAAPSATAISSITCNSAMLSWTAVSGATNYKVEYKIPSASEWTTATSTLTATTYTLSDLTASTTYNWRVTAQSACGSSTAANGTAFTTLTAPTAPTSLTVSDLDCSGATLNWTAVSGATSYKVEYKTSSAADWTIATSSLTATSYTLNGLTAGTTYNWRVTAQNSCGSSTTVTGSNFTTLASPTSPTGLSASNLDCSGATLSWTAVSGATSYKVEYKISSASEWTTAASILTATTYTLSGLAVGTTYNWRVTAQNSCGSSTVVTSSSFTTLALPATPTSLSASSITCNSAALKWNAATGAASYKVEYKTSSASDWTTATSTLTATSYTLSGLATGTTYNWRVTAQNSCGSSTAVTGSNFTTLSLPAAPTGLSTSDLNCNGVTLSWTAVSGAATYKVEYKTSSASEWTTAASTLTATTYTLSGLAVGTTYNWRVTAQNSCGSSTVVTSSSFTTLSLPATPTSLSVSSITCNSAALKWNAATGATSYKVEYKASSASEWTTAASTLTATSYTLSSLADGIAYNWRVTAQNSCGSPTTVTGSNFTTLSLPAAPTGLSTSNLDCSGATLSWTAVSGATSYKVEYKIPSASEWTTAASTLTATSYTLSGLTAGTTYIWRATAQNSCGSSTAITGSNFTTLTLPTAPTDLTVSDLDCHGATLSWTAVSGATSYKVEYKTSSASIWTMATSSLTTTSYTLSGLTNNTTYNWRITAQSSCGNSAAVMGFNFATTANCLGVIDETPDNSEAGFKVQIYPNPNSGVFKIKLSKASDGTVQIIDFAGSLILTKTFKGKEEIEINIHDHPTGAYLVKVHTSKGTVTKKIIKGN